jgi:hypothetical protein
MHRSAELKYWSAIVMAQTLHNTWINYVASDGNVTVQRKRAQCGYDIPLLVRRVCAAALLNLAASKVKQSPFSKRHTDLTVPVDVDVDAAAAAAVSVNTLGMPSIEALVALSACDLCDLAMVLTNDPVAAIRKHMMLSETKK